MVKNGGEQHRGMEIL